MPKIIDVINHLAGNDPTYPEPVTGQTPDLTLSDLDKGNSQRAALADQKINWSREAAAHLPAQAESALELLASIRNILLMSQPIDVPADFTHPRAFPIVAAGATIRIPGLNQYGYVFFPPQSAPFSVYLGDGAQQILDSVPAGTSAYAEIPHTDVLTIVCGAAAADYTFYCYPSTRPFHFDQNGMSLGTASASMDGSPNSVIFPSGPNGTSGGLASYGYMFTGVSWDRLTGSASAGLKVNSIGGVSAITQTAVTVGVVASQLTAASGARRATKIFNLGAATIYVGGPSVTVANGHPVLTNTSFVIDTQLAVFAISGTAGQDVRVLTY